MRRWIFSLIFVVGMVGTVASGARAQQPAPPAGAATAEQLFNRGVAHSKQEDFRAACPLFAESLRLDQQTGTLLHLADCEEHVGDLVQALAHWREAIGKLGTSANFLAFAKQRAEALEPRVPRLAVHLAPGAPAGTRVMRDGAELASTALGAPMPVNPGAVELVVVAPGRQERRATVTLAEGERREMTVELGAEVTAPAVVPLAPKAKATAPAGVVLVAVPEASGARRHLGSLIMGGAALALAGAGAGLGVRTWGHFQDLSKTCMENCDYTSLHREVAATNALFVAAGVAAGVGVGLFEYETRAKGRRVSVAADGAGARVVVRY